MMLVFGSLLLIAIAAFYTWRQLMPRYNWQPQLAGRSSIPYHMYRKMRWSFWRKRGQPMGYEVGFGVPLRSAMRFTIKREGMLDKAYKWLGLATEFQVGDPDFDNHLYVICDDASLCELLEHSTELQKLIRLMFMGGAIELTLNSRALYARMVVGEDGFRVDTGEFVTWLTKAAQHLSNHAPKAEPTVNSSFRLQSVLLMSMQFALFVMGIVTCGYLFMQPRLLDWVPLIRLAAIITAGVSILWFVLIGILMKDSSRRPVVMTHFFKIGWVGLFLCLCGTLYEVNRDYPSAPIRKEVTRIIKADAERFTKRRRGLFRSRGYYYNYYVLVDSWRSNQAGVQRVDITQGEFDQYHALKNQNPSTTLYLQITTHRGYFGWGWESDKALLSSVYAIR